MKRTASIKIKAAFLLIVLALNTVVGFACAMGVHMGFNAPHHEEENAGSVTVHVHANGKKHHHTASSNRHNNNETTHKHNKKKGEKEGCCNDEVLKFQNLDKQVNQNAKISIVAPVLTSYIAAFWGIDLVTLLTDPPQKLRVRFFYPPPPDILISIQKFQV